jgi:hypothetical protein
MKIRLVRGRVRECKSTYNVIQKRTGEEVTVHYKSDWFTGPDLLMGGEGTIYVIGQLLCPECRRLTSWCEEIGMI